MVRLCARLCWIGWRKEAEAPIYKVFAMLQCAWGTVTNRAVHHRDTPALSLRENKRSFTEAFGAFADVAFLYSHGRGGLGSATAPSPPNSQLEALVSKPSPTRR